MQVLQPGVTVWVRYNTHNEYTLRGRQWRRLTVLHTGSSDETEYGMNSSRPGREGVWMDDNINECEKFYVYDRFIGVRVQKPSFLVDKYE